MCRSHFKCIKSNLHEETYLVLVSFLHYCENSLYKYTRYICKKKFHPLYLLFYTRNQYEITLVAKWQPEIYLYMNKKYITLQGSSLPARSQFSVWIEETVIHNLFSYQLNIPSVYKQIMCLVKFLAIFILQHFIFTQ